MFWIKACRRCQGDLYKVEDMYGSYISCVQCSHDLTPAEEAAFFGMSDLTDVPDSVGIFEKLAA